MIEESSNGLYVRCELCGELFRYINHTHLWNVHNITCSDYQSMFPEVSMQSEVFAEEMSENMSRWWNSTEGQKKKEIQHLNFGK